MEVSEDGPVWPFALWELMELVSLTAKGKERRIYGASRGEPKGESLQSLLLKVNEGCTSVDNTCELGCQYVAATTKMPTQAPIADVLELQKCNLVCERRVQGEDSLISLFPSSLGRGHALPKAGIKVSLIDERRPSTA